MRKLTDHEAAILERPTISCENVVSLLYELVENELPSSLEARLRTHIDSCQGCQEFERSYRLTIELAGELREQPMPRAAQNRLRQALNQQLGLSLPLIAD